MMRLVAISIAFLATAGCVAPTSSTLKDYGNLPETLPESEGELLFLDTQCAVCHGYQGTGDGFLSEGLTTLPPDFTSTQLMRSRTDSDLRNAIKSGKGRIMPAYPRLTNRQVEALVRYIRTLSQGS